MRIYQLDATRTLSIHITSSIPNDRCLVKLYKEIMINYTIKDHFQTYLDPPLNPLYCYLSIFCQPGKKKVPVLVAENSKDIRGWIADALTEHNLKETARIALLAKSSISSPSAPSSSSSSGSGKSSSSSSSAAAVALKGSASTGGEKSTGTTPHFIEKAKPLALGFDVEWRPAYIKGCPYKVSLVQLSTASSVLLIQLCENSESNGTLPPLRDLMISPDVRLVGVGITHDVKKLEADYGECVCCVLYCVVRGSSCV